MTEHKDAAAIVDEIYRVTVEMNGKLDDADFLIERVEARQVLIDEYERREKSGEPMFATESDGQRMLDTIKQIMELDKGINAALERLRDEVKAKLSSAQTNQKVLGYTNSAMSGTGSYMDIKK
jgi:hypothetical protein